MIYPDVTLDLRKWYFMIVNCSVLRFPHFIHCSA